MYYNVVETGKRIRELRKPQKLTQEQLAEKLNIYVDHLGKIERGVSGASIDVLVQIAVDFNVSLDYLILGKSNKEDIKESLQCVIAQLKAIDEQL